MKDKDYPPNFNRTKLELKDEIKSEIEQLLKDFNRTKLELKGFIRLFKLYPASNFNRTKLELKEERELLTQNT